MNEIIQDGNISYIVTKKGNLIVDTEDVPRIRIFHWFISSKGYGQSSFYMGGPKKTGYIQLHRLIMSFPGREMIDHKDRNPLNNCKINLRLANHIQNGANKIRKSNQRYVGVSKEGKGYRAQIVYASKYIYLGNFKTELEAARAYDIKALELRGEFAVLNLTERKER